MTRTVLRTLVFFLCLSLPLFEASPVAADEGAGSPGHFSTPPGGNTAAMPEAVAPPVGSRTLCDSAPVPKTEMTDDLDNLDANTRLDIQCLKASYPQITGLVADEDGLWLLVGDKGRVLYSRHGSPEGVGTGPETADGWVVDVRTSMADPYPLDPERPDTPLGVSPGRKRSYDLLAALYGSTPAQVGKQLVPVRLLGQPLRLSTPAGKALAAADATLGEAVRQDPQLKAFLKMDGGFMWRRIAGESRLSPHAFGIAVDLSSRIAPYWRWSKLRPHPLQFSYPSAIVSGMEQAGFIWGGKWHEYDIMHFEYRPEIICKTRAVRDRAFQ